MPEVDLSEMSQEERREFAVEAICKMPIGEVAVGVYDEDGKGFVRLIQGSSESDFTALTMTREVALEVHASLGRMLADGSQNN